VRISTPLPGRTHNDVSVQFSFLLFLSLMCVKRREFSVAVSLQQVFFLRCAYTQAMVSAVLSG